MRITDVDVDDPLVRGAPNVGVRRQGEAGVQGQRRRARISARKRRTLASTGAGGFTASTCSKCLRERSFSPLQEECQGQCRFSPK